LPFTPICAISTHSGITPNGIHNFKNQPEIGVSLRGRRYSAMIEGRPQKPKPNLPNQSAYKRFSLLCAINNQLGQPNQSANSACLAIDGIGTIISLNLIPKTNRHREKTNNPHKQIIHAYVLYVLTRTINPAIGNFQENQPW
jgi:hypothetical protein